MTLVRYRPRCGAPQTASGSVLNSWDELLNGFWGMAPGPRAAGECSWAPRVDVRELDDRYVVQADLPGVSKDEIEVTLENDVLTISGERKLDEVKNGDRVHRHERFHGKFTRSMTFPGDVDADAVKAGFKDGVLQVEIEKSEVLKPRRIEIS